MGIGIWPKKKEGDGKVYGGWDGVLLKEKEEIVACIIICMAREKLL